MQGKKNTNQICAQKPSLSEIQTLLTHEKSHDGGQEQGMIEGTSQNSMTHDVVEGPSQEPSTGNGGNQGKPCI